MDNPPLLSLSSWDDEGMKKIIKRTMCGVILIVGLANVRPVAAASRSCVPDCLVNECRRGCNLPLAIRTCRSRCGVHVGRSLGAEAVPFGISAISDRVPIIQQRIMPQVFSGESPRMSSIPNDRDFCMASVGKPNGHGGWSGERCNQDDFACLERWRVNCESAAPRCRWDLTSPYRCVPT